MATFTITIPDAAVNDVVDALCTQGGWQTGMGTKTAFAKAQLGGWLTTAYVQYKAKQASDAAAATASATAATYANQVTVT